MKLDDEQREIATTPATIRRPSFQFYPADWRSNAKLRRCTFAERGAWIELMGLFHDSDEYGLLRWPLRDIARAMGCPLSLLESLRRKDVLKGGEVGEVCKAFLFRPRHGGKEGDPVTLIPEQEGPIWYSSRMVRDEYIRIVRAAKGEHGDSPKGDIGTGLGTGLGVHQSRARARVHSSSSSSSSELNPLSGLLPDVGRGNGNDAETKKLANEAAIRAIEYLNKQAGRNFRPVEANLKLPRSRILYDGAKESDLMAVVDAKVASAKRGEFKPEYLRPATLFNAEKFAQYVGQLGVSAEQTNNVSPLYRRQSVM